MRPRPRRIGVDVSVQAVRGAVQVSADTVDEVLSGTAELLSEVMARNGLTSDDMISIIFTTTPDLTSTFPAVAARGMGMTGVPLMCASEIAVPGALPLTVRLMAHIETDRPRSELRHVYLRGATVLRSDLSEPQ